MCHGSFSLALICLGAILAPNPAQTINFGIKNVITTAANVSEGIIRDASNLLPTPKGLFESSKQLIAGYPLEFVSSSINTICSSAVATKAITPKITPDINEMAFQLRTACKKYSYPLLKAEEIWKSPEFDSTKKVVILATGWTTTVNDTEAIDVLAQAYNCRGGVNFVAIDVASYVDTLYTWSALNTEEIGQYLAKGLVKLLEVVPLENIHLIGHSLGAHIVGAAGRHIHELTGKTLSHITGLDPAKPCFNEGESLSGLLRGDANFIDIIHSNPGVLGKRDPMGDVDFYPGGLDPLPTGCVAVTCAHARAWHYYAESVYPGNEHNFLANRCSSLTRLRELKCPGKEEPMGYAVPHNLRGNYFLEVNGASPFGKRSTHAHAGGHGDCGLCKTRTI